MAKFIDKFPFGCCDSSGLICPVTGVTGAITGIAAAMRQAHEDKNKDEEDKGCEEYVKLDGDDKVFGHKEFLDNITIRGDLAVSGGMTISDIVDITSGVGDIQGYTFRGTKAYFDEITVGSITNSGDYDGDGGSTDSGPIFITEVTAPDSVAEILESSFNDKIIKKVRTVSDELNVKVLFERGDSQSYMPQIQWFDSSDIDNKNGIDPSDISEHENGYSFYSDVNIDSSESRSYIFSNGSRFASLDVERASRPQVNTLKFINLQNTESLYGITNFESNLGAITINQTEAKSGDIARVLLNCSVAPESISVSGNHFKDQVFSDFNVEFVDDGSGVESFNVELNILVETNTLEPKNVKANVVITDSVGNESEVKRTSNNLSVNESSPFATMLVAYPNENNLINNTDDVVEVSISDSDYDFYKFQTSGGVKLVSAPNNIKTGSFQLSGSNATSRDSGVLTLVLAKGSNGKIASINSDPIEIQAFGSVPSLSFSRNRFSSSPETQSVTISSSEELASIDLKSIGSQGISSSEIVKVNDKEFTFNLTISDAAPRGQFNINFVSNKIIPESFEQVFNGEVRGFSERTLTALATKYDPVDIGVDVFDVAKLEVSVTPVGGNTFSVDYDSSITGARQDGASSLEAAFGIINNNQIVIDNQVITNAGNIKDVLIKIKENI